MLVQILERAIELYEKVNGKRPNHIVCSYNVFSTIKHHIFGLYVNYSSRIPDNTIYLVPDNYNWDILLESDFTPLEQ